MPHLLLLEPNALLAATYTAAFRHAGYTVTAAPGGQAAVLAADAQRPDVVVMELQLGGHNGIEFLHEFRSYPEWRQVSVILNTVLSPARLQPFLPALRDDLGVGVVLYKPSASLADMLHAVRAGLVAA